MKPLTAALIAVQQNAELLKGEKGDPGKDGDPGVEGKAAVDGLTWRGTFAYGTTYQPGDVVEWEGSSYVALVVTARRPPDPEWDLLAAKGEPGASGRGYIPGSALAVKDEGVSLTAAAASIDFAGAGVTATAVGTAVTVTIPAGGVSDHGALTGLADDDHPQYLTEAEADALYAPTGDYIPQGGPLTADLDVGGFTIIGADGVGVQGEVVRLRGGAGDGSAGAELVVGAGDPGGDGGGWFEVTAGDGDGLPGGFITFEAGEGAAGQIGGSITFTAGEGDAGAGIGALLELEGGHDDGATGRIKITTDNATGSSGDILTAQGDGTALWVAPAASGMTQAQVFARMTGA